MASKLDYSTNFHKFIYDYILTDLQEDVPALLITELTNVLTQRLITTIKRQLLVEGKIVSSDCVNIIITLMHLPDFAIVDHMQVAIEEDEANLPSKLFQLIQTYCIATDLVAANNSNISKDGESFIIDDSVANKLREKYPDLNSAGIDLEEEISTAKSALVRS